MSEVMPVFVTMGVITVFFISMSSIGAVLDWRDKKKKALVAVNEALIKKLEEI